MVRLYRKAKAAADVPVGADVMDPDLFRLLKQNDQAILAASVFVVVVVVPVFPVGLLLCFALFFS
jgi:hypothetical protein